MPSRDHAGLTPWSMLRPRTAVFWSGAVLCLAVILTGKIHVARAETPASEPSLHDQIDALIEAARTIPAAAPASDEEFLRRVYLTLLGRIPSIQEARQFLDAPADPTVDRRAALVDELLARPEHARRLAVWFDVMMMERRPDTHVPAADWQAWLLAAFLENRPLNEIYRDILAADGADPQSRPPARFYLDRLGETNLLTRDVGRLVLGMDLQCAQCHDHPLVDDYYQSDYYGILAYLDRGVLFVDQAKQTSYAEKGVSDPVTFKSVFTDIAGETGPKLPGGPDSIEPSYLAGCEHQVKLADGVRPQPRYSRREKLASDATSGALPAFNRNVANRLFAFVFGRGLVHPPDMHHADNPPSHPAVLDLIAARLVSTQFDARDLIRELALTRAFQLSSELPAGVSEEAATPQMLAVAPLAPLSPEQLGLSMLEATGQSEAHRAAVASELAATDPRLDDLLKTCVDGAQRRSEQLEARLYARLAPNLGSFVALYGLPAGSPQDNSQATVHQALFLSNAGVLQSWLAPGSNNLTQRLAGLSDPAAVAEELYLSVLTRRPDDTERGAVIGYLAARATDRAAAIQELAWALISSTEFRFTH